MDDKRQADYKALLQCGKNNALDNIDIKNKYFLLVVLLTGKVEVSAKKTTIFAEGPCVLCFDESENPGFEAVVEAEYFCIQFHPRILDNSLLFEALRESVCVEIAQSHNVLLLYPFTDKNCYVQGDKAYMEQFRETCEALYQEACEIREESQMYHCRSYLMEILITLERMVALQNRMGSNEASFRFIKDQKVKIAIRYIMENFEKDIGLQDIVECCGINATSLNKAMKQRVGRTAKEYLSNYRIRIARDLLASTDKPIKEIALQCGFKTVQHFSRVFRRRVKCSPAEFRQRQLEKQRMKHEKKEKQEKI